MIRFDALFDYGAWGVEITSKHGTFIGYHEWFIVAAWRAWRGYRRCLISKGSR